MQDHRRIALLIYAVAMGYLEAAVVVYLRAIYYPDGFAFPLRQVDPMILTVEGAREAATLVMIFAVAWAASRRGWQTLTGFALVFGVWDLLYYAGLKLVLNWPASLTEPDVLFLIPWVWIGPVWAPAGIALSMAVAGWLLWPMRHEQIRTRAWEWGAMVAAGLILLATFLVPPALAGVTRMDQTYPEWTRGFPVWVWCAG
ncbi:MAG: hypothetical protein GF355_11445, partial [Candidatus Eisenbacteria bacterium]|nr:hypothetical protein [Candidatus Eisenbacteria bacterium]